MGKTLYDKIWDAHVVHQAESGECLIYIDRHLVQEVSSPQAFQGLRDAGRGVHRPKASLAMPDHAMPTTPDRLEKIDDPEARDQLAALLEYTSEFKVPYIELADRRQGIVHIVGPEQGFTLPGTTLVCGDSHTSTHGALGALAFGVGTSEIEHMLATQCHIMRKAKSLRVNVTGTLPLGVTAKDMALAIIATLGTAGGTGCAIEYAGAAVRNLSMEGRMTLCNLTIEAGARTGMVAPDDTTFAYIKGRPHAPQGDHWGKAVTYWKSLTSDSDAVFYQEITLDATAIAPRVTWGTSPEDSAPITGIVPSPADYADPDKRKAVVRSLDYMGLTPGVPLTDLKVDRVFIGSCTNGRIEDIRAAAAVAKGRHVVDGLGAMVVPGSGLVKKQAEDEGLDQILIEAGFEWREPGCSMCVGINPDRIEAGQRCASTSNRNFEGRQGRGGRTHLVSPAMAAAAAVNGHLTDVRDLS
ncbi:MAG: 3-isopropylmalate dehydratase large subunit [Rhodospirillaceae bacterium]|jgi:3-isopropylmalate/(R)-2-methylmalate dehydratase large subunit|nr:3-isopropylmalate dehydratase large subunit [Rhodospirillaceae bacterium]